MSPSDDVPALSAAEVLERVVSPALAAVLRPDEVDEVHLRRDRVGAGTEFELVVIARGERFATVAYSTFVAYPEDGAAEVLRGQLADFVAESRFAWGENRDG